MVSVSVAAMQFQLTHSDASISANTEKQIGLVLIGSRFFFLLFFKFSVPAEDFRLY